MQRKIAFVFPGQGSQSPGMGKWLYDQFPMAQKTFEAASDQLKIDMKKLCFESTDAALQMTANTQPALLTVSTATAQILQSELGIQPHMTAGHSIGEYASLVLAKVIPFEVAIKAVRLRGEAMQSAVPAGQGSMMALMGPSEEQVLKICSWVNENFKAGRIQAANFNSPGQIVVSGASSALQWLRENFKPEAVLGEAVRVKMIPLNVSAPFHCEMMKPAEKTMADFFNEIPFQKAQIPIYQNLTAQKETDGTRIKNHLIAQVSGSVRWMQSVQNMVQEQNPLFIECGHGAVLKGLIKKTADSSVLFTTQSLEDFQVLRTELKPLT